MCYACVGRSLPKGGSPLDDFYDDRLKNSPRDMRSIVHEIVERSSENLTILKSAGGEFNVS